MSVLDVSTVLCSKYAYSAARNVLLFGNTGYLELVRYLPQADEKTKGVEKKVTTFITFS